VFGGAHEGGDLDRREDRRVEEEWEETSKKQGRAFISSLLWSGTGGVPIEEGCESADERVAE
jgi:hypothetical protein